MKKYLLSLCFVLIANISLAGSCPMLWNKVDVKINDITDENLKLKVQELRDEGEKPHPDGDHSKSEKLLNEALDLISG